MIIDMSLSRNPFYSGLLFDSDGIEDVLDMVISSQSLLFRSAV